MNPETILNLLKTRFVELTSLSLDSFSIDVWNPSGYVLMSITGIPTASYVVAGIHETYHVYIDDTLNMDYEGWLKEVDYFLRRFKVDIEIHGVTYEL